MKYRKKSIPVDAYQTADSVIIRTLEGDMKAEPGDWIITGVNGEQWPVKKDIFEKTYEVYPDTKYTYAISYIVEITSYLNESRKTVAHRTMLIELNSPEISKSDYDLITNKIKESFSMYQSLNIEISIINILRMKN